MPSPRKGGARSEQSAEHARHRVLELRSHGTGPVRAAERSSRLLLRVFRGAPDGDRTNLRELTDQSLFCTHFLCEALSAWLPLGRALDRRPPRRGGALA